MTHEAHTSRHVAAEANAAAELNAGLSAAAALLIADAGRARPSYMREETNKVCSTTLKLPTAGVAAAGPCCGFPRAAAGTFAGCPAGAHTIRRAAPLPASAGAWHRLSGEAERHQLQRPCPHAGLFVRN